MTRLITLSRAAHLSGLTRGALQKKIREGELPSFDGMVSTEDLCRAFPGCEVEREIDDAGAFERIARVRDEAFGRRVRERMLPSQEVLAQRLFAQGQEVAELRRHLARYHQLVDALRSDIGEMQKHRPEGALDALAARLDGELAAILGSQSEQDTFAMMDDMLRAIAARVTLRPSGREFLVEGNDTLLEAALKAGLSPGYGCGNGNCGLCKARVVAGEVRRVRNSDYVLSESEKRQGYVLMCAHAAISDVTLEALEAHGAADIPEQEIVARVRAATPLADDVMLLHLQTPRSNRLRFLAGQGVTLGAAGGSHDFSGGYLVASCPCDDRNLLFHIRRDESDAFAQRLFAGAIRSGDDIGVRGPWGDFVMGQDSERPLLFIAAANGFAPVKSLIEHAMAAETCESIALAWTAARGGHYLDNQCRAWAAALDDFRYLPLEAGDGPQAAAPLLAALASSGIDMHACEVFVAGPAGFVDAMRAACDGIEMRMQEV